MPDQYVQTSIFYNKNDVSKNNLVVDFKCPIMKYTYAIVANTSKNQQRSIEELSSQATSSEDVTALLDHVNWRMFIYLCGEVCGNSTSSTSNFQDACPNSSCSFTNSTDDLFFFASQCNNASCNEHISYIASQTWPIFFILGLLCLLGNIAVIYDEITSFQKMQNKVKEIQIYRTLVFNLALADLLMGVYVTAMAIECKRKTDFGIIYSEPGLCNALGVLNTLSSQVSLTVLLIISFFRLRGLTKPFEKQHFKLIMILIMLTWILWIFVGVVPLIPFEPFNSLFTFGLVRDHQTHKDSLIDFQHIVPFFQENILPTFDNVTEVKSVMNAVIQFSTPSVMEKFSAALGWVDSDRTEMNLLGYYNSHYTCSANFNIFNRRYRYSNFFSHILVFYNLVVSILILILYVLVTVKVREKDGDFCLSNLKWCTFPYCSCGPRRCLWANVRLQSKNAERSVENRKIFKRIAFIVFTDLMCWIPLCITALVLWSAQAYSTNQQRENYNARDVIPFQIVTVILVPINSLFNPYIYSIHLWNHLFKKIKVKFGNVASLVNQRAK